MVIMDKIGIFMENKLWFYLMYFGECLVFVDEVVIRVVEGYDVVGFEVLFMVWVFMLEIGDGVNENKENEIVVVYVMVEGNEFGVFFIEEVVDEIYLDMILLMGVVEFECIDSSLF